MSKYVTRLLLLVILLTLIAFTYRLWSPYLLTFVDDQGDRIQSIADLFGLIGTALTLFLTYMGWQQIIGKIDQPSFPPAPLPPEPKPTPNLTTARETYLNHIVTLYQFLDFRGMGMSDRMSVQLPLLEMYVPLKAHVERPEGETWSAQMRLAGRQLSEAEMAEMGSRFSEPLPVLDLLQQHSGLIVLGDPGAGKTTFLKYLALHLALGRGGALGLEGRLPVLLPLSAYANALAVQEVALEHFIATYYESRGVAVALQPLLTEALAHGKALLLLDGLDEVQQLGQRRDVVDRVVDFFTMQQQRGNKFILTSRIVGFSEVRPTVAGLTECTLFDFNDDDIALFVEKWTVAQERLARGQSGVTARAAAQEKEELLQAVRHNPGVRELAANPLLLTVLALMKRQGVELPEKRAELYDNYVKVLLRQWNLARGVGSKQKYAPDVRQVLRVLAPLALWMHETSPGIGLVKEHQMRRKLNELHQAQQVADPELATTQFLKDVRDHASLLLERGNRQYGFIHLTFQEYLAGVAIARRAQESVEEAANLLARHAGSSNNWREVSLLAIGNLSIVLQSDVMASQVLVELVKRDAQQPGEAVLLAGEALLDVGQDGVTANCFALVTKALQVMLTGRSVPPRLRLRAGLVLSDLGVIPTDLDDLVTKPGWGFKMGKYPVTNGQFARFMAAKEHEQEQPETPSLWQNDKYNRQMQPVVGVSWYEAMAYCAWLTEEWRQADKIGRHEEVRLPTEAEWLLAAGKNENRRYPWGNQFEPFRANTKESDLGQPSPVHMHPDGRTPEGIWDMGGNVWEWLLTGEEENRRWLKGGSFYFDENYVKLASRDGSSPPYGSDDLGFRIVVAPIS